MKFLSTSRERLIVSHIRDQDEIIVTAAKEIVRLQEALTEAIRVQREITVAWIISRDQPEVELDFDLDGMLVSLNDQIAMMEEHFSP